MIVNAHGISIEIRAKAVIEDTNQGLLLVEGFIKVMNCLEMTLKEEKGRIFKCLVAHSQLYSLPVEVLNVIVELSV